MRTLFLSLILLSLFLTADGRAAMAGCRFGGGPLTRSVQNEANAAIDNAATWLQEQQAADGAWATNDVRLTSLCAIALLSSWDPRLSIRPPSHENCERAVRWLRSPAATNALAALEGDEELSARAWREMALCAFTAGKAPMDDALLRPLPVTNAPVSRAAHVEWPAAEARRFRNLPTERPASTNRDAIVRFISGMQGRRPPSPSEKKLADDLAQAWSDSGISKGWTENAEYAWWLARMVNRSANGEIRLHYGRDGEIARLDWRREMAGHWISSQKIDADGKGHWGDASLEKTAFAILLLGEL